jgi:predicted nuclease with RNAse H fold
MENKKRSLTVVGIDLAGVPHRPTGACLLANSRALTLLLYDDQEILSFIRENEPDLIAVDAPLCLPPGRKSMADKNAAHFRPCDEELRRRKIPFFPITLGPMRGLTERGINLKRHLEAEGFCVIEIYPGGAQDVWRIPRVKASLLGLRKGLERLGIKGLKAGASGHELDAVTGALAGLLFLKGKAEVLGDFKTGAIVMPRASSRI